MQLFRVRIYVFESPTVSAHSAQQLLQLARATWRMLNPYLSTLTFVSIRCVHNLLSLPDPIFLYDPGWARLFVATRLLVLVLVVRMTGGSGVDDRIEKWEEQ